MNIYVGNLPFGVMEDELRQVFEAYGEVSSAKIITDKMTGKSRGFGFVEMPDDSAAQSAVDQLNGSDMQGRSLTVSEARPRQDSGGGRGGYRNDRGGGGRDRY